MAIYERKETWDEQAVEELKNSYNAILKRIGEDPNREGLLKTPERAAKAMAILTSGNGSGSRGHSTKRLILRTKR